MIIFEDDPNSPMSRLLKLGLGNNVDFASGDRGLENLILKYVDKKYNEKLLCFIDYVYDNPDIIGQYDSLVEVYQNDVTFIKIPCIELYAYLLLQHFNIPQKFINVNNDILEYCLCKTSHKPQYVYVQDSFEKYLKALTEIRPSCINTSAYGSKNKGKFYYMSCNCGEVYCKLTNKTIDVSDKSMYVLNLLGLNDKLNSKIKVDLELLYKRMSYYTELKNITSLRAQNRL